LARKLTIIAEAEQAVRRREEESEERWVRQIGEGENGCLWAKGKIVILLHSANANSRNSTPNLFFKQGVNVLQA
jgi:hypothetical protein